MNTTYHHTSTAVLPVNIEFENVSLGRIAAVCRVRYGIRIHLSSKSVADLRYTGTFHSGDSWELILHRIANELSLKYKMLEFRSFELSVFV